ncbi:hypothetical protein ACQKL6_09495, partial [Peribacillus sp. NPDC097197]|uniref:hypothetical protein n=1 Tax=Peribacillus sp. NPDC097197 TaxID=3390615 RepID=UPI003D0052F3
SVNYYRNRKTGGEKQLVFLHLFYFRDLLDSPFLSGDRSVGVTLYGSSYWMVKHLNSHSPVRQ